MYQVETDSEDDYECLFLKPVDGYNISDRIKLANEELFASPGPVSPSVIPRKVTFRKVLEEYDDLGDNLSIVSVESTGANPDENNVKEKLKHIPEIEEEEEKDEDNEKEEKLESETEEICEEICEEIIEFKLENDEIINTPNSIKTENNFKNNITIKNEENTLKVPVLPTLQEERDSSIKFKEISLNSPYTSFDKTTISSSSSEDDLSVIVASYLPEEFEVIEEKSTTTSTTDNEENKKTKGKKFSFRRKKKSAYSPSSVQQQQQQKIQGSSKQNLKGNQNKITDKFDIDETKFYYKTCCEYKNAIDTNATLPKYTGYLSEYGLSKDQLEKRQLHKEKQKNKVMEKNVRATEFEIQKMDDNERAFTRWLKNKMRFPVNKTKNMFDFHQNKNAKKVKC